MLSFTVFIIGLCVIGSQPGAEASLFSSVSQHFSPSPTSTNVGQFRLFSHPNLQKYDEVNDTEILLSVMQSMKEYTMRIKAKQKHRRHKRDEEVACYDDLGCFRDSGPFDYLDILPSPPEEVGTTFLFHTRRNAIQPETVSFSAPGQLEVSAFNSSLPTKLIVHGFGSSCSHVWVHEMRQALLTTIDCNVICVNWDKGAATPNYMRAAANTRLVGRQVAILIKDLVDRYKASLDGIHLIGFSLGAHVSGFAGEELQGNISRITGLDPAGPLFEGYSPSARLDATDAKFVDVIHSNGDSLLKGGLGTWQQLGHVDFYPNGGRMQKGCTNLFLGAFSDLIWSGPGNGRSLCNHRRSYRFFIDSISPVCTFPATPCPSYEELLSGECFPCGSGSACGNMGYYADRSSARGKLYLITREDEPFCANQHRVTLSGLGSRDGPTYGRLEVTLVSSNGVNETFPLTNGDGDEISRTLVRMLVAHPAIQYISRVQMRYTAYNGWLYTGTPAWTIDKLLIVNSYGSSVSYCQRNMVLPSGKPVLLTLRPGNCRPSSFRPNAAFWGGGGQPSPPPPPPSPPPATVPETVPQPPPLGDISANQVRSLAGRGWRRGPPRPPPHGDVTEGAAHNGSRVDQQGDFQPAAGEAKPLRGPDDLGVIVVHGGDTRRLEELATVSSSSSGGGGGGRRGKAILQVTRSRQQLNATRPEPVYYVQYLPPELFSDPAADYIPSPAVLPPPVRPPPPPPAGRPAGRARSLRLGFLRHLFPSWEAPETRYIPLHEVRGRNSG